MLPKTTAQNTCPKLSERLGASVTANAGNRMALSSNGRISDDGEVAIIFPLAGSIPRSGFPRNLPKKGVDLRRGLLVGYVLDAADPFQTRHEVCRLALLPRRGHTPVRHRSGDNAHQRPFPLEPVTVTLTQFLELAHAQFPESLFGYLEVVNRMTPEIKPELGSA